MELDLSYAERLDLLLMLPTTGTFMMLRAAQDLRPKLELTQAEMKAVDMQQEGSDLSWDSSQEAPKKVKFTEMESELVAKVLKDADAREKLTLRQMALYEAFVGVPEK